MPGVGLTSSRPGQARADRLALEPYWGKPTVRNLRGGGGNVGIIRSPVRATALPDPSLRPVRLNFGTHSKWGGDGEGMGIAAARLYSIRAPRARRMPPDRRVGVGSGGARRRRGGGGARAAPRGGRRGGGGGAASCRC